MEQYSIYSNSLKNITILLYDFHCYAVASIPTDFYPCFTFLYTLIYWFWICELMEWSQKKRLILKSANFYIFVFNVLLFIPADSAWRVCEPPELCISSLSLHLLQLQSVPARSERCETTLCIKIKLLCGWRPSSELQNKINYREIYRRDITIHVQAVSSTTSVYLYNHSLMCYLIVLWFQDQKYYKTVALKFLYIYIYIIYII